MRAGAPTRHRLAGELLQTGSATGRGRLTVSQRARSGSMRTALVPRRHSARRSHRRQPSSVWARSRSISSVASAASGRRIEAPRSCPSGSCSASRLRPSTSTACRPRRASTRAQSSRTSTRSDFAAAKRATRRTTSIPDGYGGARDSRLSSVPAPVLVLLAVVSVQFGGASAATLVPKIGVPRTQIGLLLFATPALGAVRVLAPAGPPPSVADRGRVRPGAGA